MIDLSPLVPAIGGVLAALIALVGGYLVARTLKPSEANKEMRDLRQEVRDADDKVESVRRDFETFRTVIGRKVDVLGRGFDAAYRLAERRAHCKDGDPMPEPDATDQADITAALKVRDGTFA